jgi:hypothetical protein
MKPNRPVRDEDLDALLARRYRDTTPEFEARWVALKRDLRQSPVRRRLPWSGWIPWLALGGAAAAFALVASFTLRPVPPAEAELSPALAELFTMDSVLSRGSVLLETETREALLHLPAQSQPRS